MTVRIEKPAFNVRDKLSELDKPVGLKGTELMRSETIQDARNVIGAGRKNLIINGAMEVAQRKPSGEYTGQAAYATVDRMRGQFAVPNTDPISEAHVLTSGDVGPWEEGFRKSYRMKIGYQGTAAATHFYGMQYRIEAQDIASSGWNYNSSTSYITLSFWIKSSVSYNPSWYLRAKDGTEKIYRWQPGMLVANTWTKLTKTFPGNSSLTFNNDNGEGLQINLSPYWGTNYSSSNPTMDSWENFDSATRAKDTDPIWFETNGTSTEITGLQLEVGSSATKFEHLPYSEDLRRCQRYFEKYTASGGNSGRGPQIGAYNSTRYFGYINCSPKRHSNLSLGFGGSLRVETINLGSSTTVTAINDYTQIDGGSGIFLEVNTSSWGSAGTLYHLSFPTNAYITIDSEL